MKDYYQNVRKCIDRYNTILDDLEKSTHSLTDDREEFILNFCIYFAHALIKDTGRSDSTDEFLSKVADIINDVVR